MDSYVRRENLILIGIAEEQNEHPDKTRKIVLDLFETKLGITEARSIKFQRCHRMGYTRDRKKQPRDIIIRFVYYPDRETVWDSRFKLEGSGIYMKEDFCREIEDRRSQLFPILKAAKSLNMKARIRGDMLTVNGKNFTVQNLDMLPAELQLKKLAERRTETAVLFHGSHSCFSNFYKVSLSINDCTYNSVEQYFQQQKAMQLKNEEAASKIMELVDPVAQYRLGKSLKVDDRKWDIKTAQTVMETAILAKFTQHADLKEELLKTKGKLLIECNPYEHFWSCGLKLSHEEAYDRSKWTGDNVLGKILTDVRDAL